MREEVKGPAKEAAGDLPGDDDMPRADTPDQATGSIKDKEHHAVDTVREQLHSR